MKRHVQVEGAGAGLRGAVTAVCVPAMVQQLQQDHRGRLHFHGRTRPPLPGSPPAVVR